MCFYFWNIMVRFVGQICRAALKTPFTNKQLINVVVQLSTTIF